MTQSRDNQAVSCLEQDGDLLVCQVVIQVEGASARAPVSMLQPMPDLGNGTPGPGQPDRSKDRDWATGPFRCGIETLMQEPQFRRFTSFAEAQDRECFVGQTELTPGLGPAWGDVANVLEQVHAVHEVPFDRNTRKP